MIVKNINEIDEKQVLDYPYKGKSYKVGSTIIRWLTQCCDPQMPSYGLRLFTIGPQGYIPIHNHEYLQTMYILTGKISVACYNDKDEVLEEKILKANGFVYIPRMQPHSMKNIDDEPIRFLCCIAVLSEDELALVE